MFFADEARLEAAFPAARARLEELARGSSLAGLARDAYGGALASVSFLDLVARADTAILGVRWNTAGRDGAPFPALDANIILTADGKQASVLRMEGTCRAPDDEPGTAAAVAVHSFIDRLAKAIASPVRCPGEGG